MTVLCLIRFTSRYLPSHQTSRIGSNGPNCEELTSSNCSPKPWRISRGFVGIASYARLRLHYLAVCTENAIRLDLAPESLTVASR
jgi:hypothetical protein